MEVRIRLRLGHMETFGTGSLTGALVNQNPDVALAQVTKLTIEVEVTSPQWKDLNKGPHLSLMPEYVPIELMRDLLSLSKRGMEINIVEVLYVPTVHPRTSDPDFTWKS